MAVKPSDLLSPIGKIDKAFFPGEDDTTLEERLQAYINEGALLVTSLATSAEQDAATTLWAYYRAFEAVYMRLMATPSSVSIADEGSTSFSSQQIAMFGTTAQQFRTAFDAALVIDSALEPAIPSGAVTNRYRF